MDVSTEVLIARYGGIVYVVHHILMTGGRECTQVGRRDYDANPNPLWHVQFTRDSLADIGPSAEESCSRNWHTNLWHTNLGPGESDKRSAWRRYGSAIWAYRKRTRRDARRDLLSFWFL